MADGVGGDIDFNADDFSDQYDGSILDAKTLLEIFKLQQQAISLFYAYDSD